MTYYIKNGEGFHPSKEGSLDIRNELPPGNYLVKMTPQKTLFFESTEDMPMMGKVYGDTTSKAKRIMSTFKTRTASTGVMLAGEKGCGKTMLAKMLTHECKAVGVPCIIVNAPWTGDIFNELIQGLQQPCMVLFDEFEKVYDEDQQEAILTLLDGVFPTKKLFVFTCNSKHKVDVNMQNRPGRIFYMIDYKGLDVDFIREYCEDNLKNKAEIPFICKASLLFESFNFDMLKALVEEMNRYDEPAAKSLEMLNAKPEFNARVEYGISITKDGLPLMGNMWPQEFNGNPSDMKKMQVDITVPKESLEVQEVITNMIKNGGVSERSLLSDENDNEEDGEHYRFVISAKDLISVEVDKGEFIFKADENTFIKLTKIVQAKVNPYSLL